MKQNLLFQALTDPTRRMLLKHLRAKDMIPGEMMKYISMSKPSLSHHLDVLKKADLVTTQRKGQNIVYSLNVSVYEEIVSVVLDILGTPEKSKKVLNTKKNISEKVVLCTQ